MRREQWEVNGRQKDRREINGGGKVAHLAARVGNACAKIIAQ